MATSQAIQVKIVANIYTLKNIKDVARERCINLKSSVWNFMSAIVDEANNVIESHVCCRMCKQVFKYRLADKTTGRSGTSNLSKHLKSCKQARSPARRKSKYNTIFCSSFYAPQFFRQRVLS